ncbi:MAG: MmgE/PrpD family protein [Alphaproteobacteria bacterium]|nr:MmgE/PrpD family protein [Alphaproteobacteria bacterium]
MKNSPSSHSLASCLADFAVALSWDDIPEAVLNRAKLQILDALGTGIAATAYPFAGSTIAGVREFGGKGPCSVIGHPDKLVARDAALANGVLVHGLDFDDTHLSSIVHPTAACLPAALAMAETTGAGGKEMLAAFVAGMETAIRIGLVADGAFHHAGYHATAIASHFSSSVIAGKLLGLDAAALTSAQGITGSTAAGIQVFLEEGAWTKRLHPGWGAVAGITAAYLARNGFVGPSRPYEGKFGLFETHFQGNAAETDPNQLADGLGERWRLAETAIKPYPVCHFIHGCADAAIELSHEVNASDIETVEALLPEPTLPIVAEPAEAKMAPQTDYEAKFSAQFVVAACLARGRFGLAELSDAALSDPELTALTKRVRCSADPDTAFPDYFSGGVRVALRDGQTLARHIRVNSGAGERLLDSNGVAAKFLACAETQIGADSAERICDLVLTLERHESAALGAALAAG